MRFRQTVQTCHCVFTILYLGGRLPACGVDVSGAVGDFIRSSGGVSQSSARLMFLTNRESPGRLDGILQ